MSAPQPFWQATDVLRGWPEWAVEEFTRSSQSDDLAPGEQLVATGASPGGLIAVQQGSLTYGDIVLRPGNVLAPHHAVTGRALDCSVHAGQDGALLSRVPKSILDGLLRLHPDLRDSILRNVETAAPETHSMTSASVLTTAAAPDRAALPSGASAAEIWRQRLRAFAALAQPQRASLAAASLAAALLALPPAMFAKFIVDRVMVEHINTWWPQLAAIAGAALVLQVLTRNAGHYLLFAFSRGSVVQTETGSARACAMLLQALSLWVFPVAVAAVSLPLAAVVVLTAAAQLLLLYRNAAWEGSCTPPDWIELLRSADAIARDDAAAAAVHSVVGLQQGHAPASSHVASTQLLRNYSLSRYAAAAGQAALLALGMFMVQNHGLSLGQWVAVMLIARQQNQVLRSLLFRSGLLPLHAATHDMSSPVARSQGEASSALAWDGGVRAVDAAATNLRGATFALAGGARLGVVGPSGSGKTTLARLIAGDLPLHAGRLEVPEDWRDHVAWLSHDSALMGGRLLDAVAPSSYYPAAGAMHALAMACAADVVDSLPQGLDTHLGFNDPRLCRSARMRLLVARLLLTEPRFIVLDGALDVMSRALAHAILTNIRRELPQASMLLISRRRGLLRRCDTLVALQHGSIVQQADFTSLSHTATFAGWVEHA